MRITFVITTMAVLHVIHVISKIVIAASISFTTHAADPARARGLGKAPGSPCVDVPVFGQRVGRTLRHHVDAGGEVDHRADSSQCRAPVGVQPDVGHRPQLDPGKPAGGVGLADGGHHPMTGRAKQRAERSPDEAGGAGYQDRSHGPYFPASWGTR